MPYRITKVYTRTGDKGLTRLGEGTKVEKDNVRIECYGTIDELNSAIGLILADSNVSSQISTALTQIQHHLFDMGGELCVPNSCKITKDYSLFLEKNMDLLNEKLPFLKNFILPRGCLGAAAAHLARTICRRAERRLVTLHKTEKINPETLKYINRLSDFLFVVSRTLTHQASQPEILWEPHKIPP